jgi:hypothetical protein
MSEKIEFILDHPFDFGKERIEKLELRRPKAKDLRGIPEHPRTGDLLDVAVRIANQPKSLIDELDGADTFRLMEVIGGFLESSQRTEKA